MGVGLFSCVFMPEMGNKTAGWQVQCEPLFQLFQLLLIFKGRACHSICCISCFPFSFKCADAQLVSVVSVVVNTARTRMP